MVKEQTISYRITDLEQSDRPRFSWTVASCSEGWSGSIPEQFLQLLAAERGPKVIMPMRQPHTAMTAGVRHVVRCVRAGGMSTAIFPAKDGSGLLTYPSLRLSKNETF